MTPEKQNIAIATTCGKKQVERHPSAYHEGRLRHMVHGMWHWLDVDYTQDLNACHAMEKMLFDGHPDLWESYLARLFVVVADERPTECATAAQRSEAFLRTLSLWEDGE